jgi:hypothetical protein
MTASTLTHSRPSFRHSLAGAAVLALVALVACDKKPDEAPATGSTPAAAAPAAAAAAKKPATSLKLADLKQAYKAEFDDMSKMALPIDKKVDAFVAKVGKPESDSGRSKIWYALDGDKCSKVTIDGKDGSITDETTSNGDCGK